MLNFDESIKAHIFVWPIVVQANDCVRERTSYSSPPRHQILLQNEKPQNLQLVTNSNKKSEQQAIIQPAAAPVAYMQVHQGTCALLPPFNAHPIPGPNPETGLECIKRVVLSILENSPGHSMRKIGSSVVCSRYERGRRRREKISRDYLSIVNAICSRREEKTSKEDRKVQ